MKAADHLAAGVDRAAFGSGGGGLVSSARDYHRLTQMLLRGGELHGQRLLGSRTVAFVTRNHLPGGVDRGVGFGLGFSVNLALVDRPVPDGLRANVP